MKRLKMWEDFFVSELPRQLVGNGEIGKKKQNTTVRTFLLVHVGRDWNISGEFEEILEYSGSTFQASRFSQCNLTETLR